MTKVKLFEKVIIKGQTGRQKKYVAKMDTGADRTAVDYSVAAAIRLGPIVGETKVNGERRPLVKATIKIKDKIYDKVICLANRAGKKNKILIGCDILKHFEVIPRLR